jgi:hypothetical protein
MAQESGFDRDEAMFLSIMYSFHVAAMQQLGKIANPLSGKVERDMEAARGTIDVLQMFQKKTRGNLSERERRTLTNLITELQLNYVDELKREPAAAGAEKAPPAEAAPGGGTKAESPAAPPEEGPIATPPAAPEPPAEARPEPAAEAEKEKAITGEAEKEPPPKKKAAEGRARKRKKGE